MFTATCFGLQCIYRSDLSSSSVFSGFSIWESVSQLMGVELIFPSPWYNAQFYNKTANITIFLYCLFLGA